MIYLDNSATTKIDPRVAEKMIPFIFENYGNPSSKYTSLATTAKQALLEARENVAKLLNCSGEEIIFNSGSSEGNNHVIKMIAEELENKGKHLITSEIEHKSVLESFKYLETKGFQVTYLKPDEKGEILPKVLEEAIRKDTILVSIMWGNNEIGTLNNIRELSEITKKNGILFHTDATQVVGKIEVNLKELKDIDFLTLSAHKIYGPKGTGCLFTRADKYGIPYDIKPLISGTQENGMRGGTQCVHNIVGLGEAAKLIKEEFSSNVNKVKNLEEYLVKELENFQDKISINGNLENKIPGIVNISVKGILNEMFIKQLSSKIAISTGSACNINEPSYVLRAIGLEKQKISQSIRISIGKNNNQEDLEALLQEIKNKIGV